MYDRDNVHDLLDIFVRNELCFLKSNCNNKRTVRVLKCEGYFRAHHILTVGSVLSKKCQNEVILGFLTTTESTRGYFEITQ